MLPCKCGVIFTQQLTDWANTSLHLGLLKSFMVYIPFDLPWFDVFGYIEIDKFNAK